MTEWIITFVLSWLMLILLIDKKHFKYTFWGGAAAVALQLIIDTGADILGIYEVTGKFKIGGGSAFFTFGTVFTMGVLFVQFLPTNHWLKAAHIIATATLFLGLEYLLVQRSLINYTHWGMMSSWFINILVFIAISWIYQNIVLNTRVS